jgi:peptidyl-prolyl cis-trans isomerase A (cyclophilin A)
MPGRCLSSLLGSLFVLLAWVLPASSQNTPAPRVRVETSLGAIVMELYPDKAPGTVANFLRYVDAGHFDGGQFHRTVTPENQPNDSVRIEVIQGSVAAARTSEAFPAIPLERTSVSGLRHLDGTLSMARGGPDSARSSFFICIGDQPSLDFGGHRNLDGQGFAAFGRVLEGMDVVRRIQRSPAEGQNLNPPIRIVSARRL